MRTLYVDATEPMQALCRRVGADILPDIEIHLGDPDEASLIEMSQGFAGILNGHTYMPRRVLEACPALRVVVFLGTGASSYVDLAAAAALGIRALAIPGYGNRTIAEHTIGLMFAAVRRLAIQDRTLRDGRWQQQIGFELEGKTLGVIGLGGVGREVARLGHAIGMEVIAWNRSGVPADTPCRAVEFDELLSNADVVSLHVAHTAETEAMIGAPQLERMRSHAVLVNTARGALIDEAALADALSRDVIAHAAVDVYAREPIDAGHPFLALDNITLSAHSAWNSPEAAGRLMSRALAKLRDELAR